MLPAFLYTVLSADAFFAFVMGHAKGAKMPRGNKSMILRYRIPVPPLEVQRDIVRILDTFSKLETQLKEELEARRRQYAHYRNTLLSLDGRTRERETVLDELADFKYGYTASAIESGKYRFLRITDIDPWGKLNPDGAKFVGDGPGIEEYLASEGDVLMARTGATFGKTMLVAQNEPSVYASFLIRIRLDSSSILPSFYWHFAQSDRYWSQARTLVGTGGQPQFNANVLKRVMVPVPSLAEQERIVDILDSFDALVNDISIGLPAELVARRKQYEHYRDRLLAFEERPV